MSSSIEIFNEVYFGEQPELSQALIYLRLFREKFSGIKNITNISWGSDKNLDKFNICMQELFGFKSFFLNVYADFSANAHTATCKYSLASCSRNNKIVRTSKGFKYNGLVSAIVTISSSLIFNSKYTDRQIMGIILHEIGHCFSNKISPIIDIEGKIVGALTFPYLIVNFMSNPYTNIELLSSFSERMKIYYIKMKQSDIYGNIFNALQAYKNLTYNIINAIVASIPGIRFIKLKNGKIPVTMPIDYLDENIADNFATIYGFGPDLVEALSLIDTDTTKLKGVIYETPVIGWLSALADISAEFAVQLFDVHPTISSRRKAQYNYLINEMNKEGVSPKFKKEIMDEINRMEECMHTIETTKGRFGGKLFYAKANELIDRLKRGDDIRDYIFRYDKYIDKAYDRVEEA